MSKASFTKEQQEQLHIRSVSVPLILSDIHRGDAYAPPTGTIGTIVGIDSMGDIMVHWNNDSSLSVILEAGDQFEKVADHG